MLFEYNVMETDLTVFSSLLVQKSLVSVKYQIGYSGSLYRPLPPYCALAEQWGGGRCRWRRFCACCCFIDLNLARWRCRSDGGSLELELWEASTLTSGWRGGRHLALCLLCSLLTGPHSRLWSNSRPRQRLSLHRKPSHNGRLEVLVTFCFGFSEV